MLGPRIKTNPAKEKGQLKKIKKKKTETNKRKQSPEGGGPQGVWEDGISENELVNHGEEDA